MAIRLRVGDLAHGVVEGEAGDAHEEVDGVADLVTFGPAAVAVLANEPTLVFSLP